MIKGVALPTESLLINEFLLFGIFVSRSALHIISLASECDLFLHERLGLLLLHQADGFQGSIECRVLTLLGLLLALQRWYSLRYLLLSGRHPLPLLFLDCFEDWLLTEFRGGVGDTLLFVVVILLLHGGPKVIDLLLSLDGLELGDAGQLR